MSAVQPTKSLTSAFEPFSAPRDPFQFSSAASADANAIATSLRALQVDQMSPGRPKGNAAPAQFRSLEERLFDSLAQAKQLTANVAMHLDRAWRDKLFAKLDKLLAAEDWHDEDLPITAASFATFLRMIIYMSPQRRPGLGVSNAGNIIAAWTNQDDRLTLEFFPSDKVRWVLSRSIDGQRERAAGDSYVSRIPDILASYNPGRWFADAEASARG